MTDRLTDLLGAYRAEAPAAFPVPDLGSLDARARRHRKRRVGLVVAVVAIGLVVGFAVRPSGGNPIPPAPVATSIYAVDWADTELTLPHNPDRPCGDRRVRLLPYQDAELGRVGTSTQDMDEYVALMTTGRVVFGDLTGDGAPEAVISVRCHTRLFTSVDGVQLLVVQMLPDHSLQGLQFVGRMNATFPSYRIRDGLLHVQMRYNEANPYSWGETWTDTAFTQVLRWNGTAFDLIAGRSDPLNFTGAHQGYGVPTQLADILAPTGEVRCPAALVPFAFAPYTVDAHTYADDNGLALTPPQVDVDDDGNDELVVPVRCTGEGYEETSVYVLTQGTDRFLAIDVPFTSTAGWRLESYAVSDLLRLGLTDPTGGSHTVELAWTGARYEPSGDWPEGFPGPAPYRLVP